MPTRPLNAPMRVLLVDDDVVDVRMTLEALRHVKMVVMGEAVFDGFEALAYLRQQGRYAKSPRPNLILLDLNMPKTDGREVLAAIKADPALCRIPVIILTTSKAEQDVLAGYGLGANAYIAKPVDLDEVQAVMNLIVDFWFTLAQLPLK